MSDDGRKRFESELTVIIDRSKLPPPSGPTIEQLADIERARRDAQDDRETQCECPWCHIGLVSFAQRDAWLAKYPELAVDQAPPSQPEEPPPSRPKAA